MAAAMLPASGWRLAVLWRFSPAPRSGWSASLSSFWIPAAGATMDWAYPAVQPLARLVTGVWLWRAAAQDAGDV